MGEGLFGGYMGSWGIIKYVEARAVDQVIEQFVLRITVVTE